VAALCDDAIPAVADPGLRAALAAVRAKLGEPLRVAIAGSVSSGKSTLVNALLGRAVAPVDAGDCTKVVTWFRFGFPERVELHDAEGRVRARPLATGEALAEAAGALDGVVALTAFLSNERLRAMTLIDTPGLDSIEPGRELATQELLGLGEHSREAVAAADALVLLMPLARRFDGDLLQRFGALYDGSALSAANAIGVISKVDRLASPGEDPWPIARDAARRAAADLALTVGHVAPLAGLIAATASTGQLTEADARALAALEAAGPARLDDTLLSAADLMAADVDVPPAHRERLLRLLDLYGIRVAAPAAAHGGASAVIRALRGVSGIGALDEVLQSGLARRADALKAYIAVSKLDRLSYTAAAPDDAKVLRRLRDPLDRLGAEAGFHELRLLDVVRWARDAGPVLGSELVADVERVAAGDDPRGRLGLAPDATAETLRAAAGDAAARWATWGNDPRRDARQRAVARDMRTAYEWIWHDA
jgi:hypothetical protein